MHVCVFRNLSAIIPIFKWDRGALPQNSLAKLLQSLAWQDLERATFRYCLSDVLPAQLDACFTGLAEHHCDKAHAKHPLRLYLLHTNVLELAQDFLDNVRVNERFLRDDVFQQGCPGCTILVRV